MGDTFLLWCGDIPSTLGKQREANLILNLPEFQKEQAQLHFLESSKRHCYGCDKCPPEVYEFELGLVVGVPGRHPTL